jgi:hypothetical protein
MQTLAEQEQEDRRELKRVPAVHAGLLLGMLAMSLDGDAAPRVDSGQARDQRTLAQATDLGQLGVPAGKAD